MDYGRNDTSAKDKEVQDGWFARQEANKDLRQPLVNPPGYSDRWKDDYDHFHDPLRTRRPKWESTSVLFSTVSFLLYWGLLREENDWDHALYELEEQYIESAIEHQKTYGKNPSGQSVEELNKRLVKLNAVKLARFGPSVDRFEWMTSIDEFKSKEDGLSREYYKKKMDSYSVPK